MHVGAPVSRRCHSCSPETLYLRRTERQRCDTHTHTHTHLSSPSQPICFCLSLSPADHPHLACTVLHFIYSTQSLLSRDGNTDTCRLLLHSQTSLVFYLPYVPLSLSLSLSLSSHLITLLCQFPPHPCISLSCNLTPLLLLLLHLPPSLPLYPLFSPSI